MLDCQCLFMYIKFKDLLASFCWTNNVMNIEWDYNYYQLWSDNEWLVDEMLAMLDENIIMQ